MGNAACAAREVGALVAAALSGALVFASPAYACPAPTELRATALDRHFTEEKFISGMSKPLTSEGRLTASADEVVWHMTSPFDVKTIIAPSGITQSIDGGTASPVAPGAAEMGAGVARSMAALMRGQWEELKTLFEVTLPAAPAAGSWQVELKPRDQRLQGVLGAITVHGCQDVSSVEIARADGDHETIHFDGASKAP
ncbi:MAG TPA: LolA-related protein [Parvibaculum sp.]